MVIRVDRLESGLSIVSEDMPGMNGVSLSITSRLGAMDEHALSLPAGTAHFLEHMIFRASRSYAGEESSRLLEGLGADPNAMTGSDYVSYEMFLPAINLHKALPILLDMVGSPRLLGEEMEIERSVIQQEIGEGMDDPSLVIQDAWYAHAFRGHAMANSIIGTRESVASISQEDLACFHRHGIAAENTVISIAGSLDTHEVMDDLRDFIRTSGMPVMSPRRTPAEFHPGRVVVPRDFEQFNVVMGKPCADSLSPRRATAVLASVILGGGMSSLLNVEVRERRGLAYSVSSHISNELNASVFTMWAAADASRADEAVRAMLGTVERAAMSLDEATLELARNKMRAALLLEGDSPIGTRQRNTREFLYHGCVRPLPVVLDRLNAVGLEDVRSLLSEWAQTPWLIAATGEGAECIEGV